MTKIVNTKPMGINVTECRGDFNWDLYENGYNGRNLKENTSIKTGNKKTKVYCHEAYASELLAKYMPSLETITSPKDFIRGSYLRLTGISRATSNTSFIASTSGGSSIEIDMNKERDYLKCAISGASTPAEFVENLNDPNFVDEFISSNVMIKIDENYRPSLMGGHIHKVNEELGEQLRHPSGYYEASILSTNRGGYIVDIMGVKCFLPGSMAAPGIITDFESLVGKVVPVMVINYVNGLGYIVSYKKYLASILPAKISEELHIDDKVYCTVTGLTKVGAFVSFKDKEGEPVFTGMIVSSECCDMLVDEFKNGTLSNGDSVPAFIHAINYMNDGSVRIVLGDVPTTDERYISKKNAAEKEREK